MLGKPMIAQTRAEILVVFSLAISWLISTKRTRVHECG
jgi:hypothetical protein